MESCPGCAREAARLVVQGERRDVAPADPLSASRRARGSRMGALRGSRARSRERVGRGKRAVDLPTSGNSDMSQYHSKCARVKVATRRGPRGRARARAPGRPAAVDEVDDEAKDDALEPAVLERQVLGAPSLRPTRLRRPPSRPRASPRTGRRPRPARPARRARARGARAAADVEDAPAAKVALATRSSTSSHQLSSIGRSRS